MLKKLVVPTILSSYFAFPGTSCAQIPGKIQGVVLSADTGKPLANVTVVGTTTDTSTVGTVVTDSLGRFVVDRVGPGRYWLSFSAPPGSNYVSEHVDVLGDARGEALEVEVKAGTVVNVTKTLQVGGELLVRTILPNRTAWSGFEEMDIEVSFTKLLATGDRFLIDGNLPHAKTPSQVLVRGLPSTRTLEVVLHPDGYRQLTFQGIEIKTAERTTLDAVIDPNHPTGIEGFATPNLSITVGDTSGAHVAITTSDQSGRFSVLGLAPGRYKVSVIGTEVEVEVEVEVTENRRTQVDLRTRRQGLLDWLEGGGLSWPVAFAASLPPRRPTLRPCGGTTLKKADEDAIVKAVQKIREKIEGSDCLGPRCKDFIIPKLFKTGFFEQFGTTPFTIIVGCRKRILRDCADIAPTPLGTEPIRLRIDPNDKRELVPAQCGCLESILFHEMMHVKPASFSECDSYRCALNCFPECAQPVPDVAESLDAWGHTIRQECKDKTPGCCDDRCP